MTQSATNPAASLPLESSYGRLPDDFYARVAPTPVCAPQLLRLNSELARELGLSPEWLRGENGLALLSGNRLPEELEPLAMAYAGHQFGSWNPSLGDGRAILLGEVVGRDGTRRDVQLKGAGPTPFSRRGDGRSALGPVLREYVMSEAMHALGIPTTRALAMVATGETVVRERPEAGGILTRVAQGHIRVGTFQYFHGRGMKESVRALADYVIDRQFPQARDAENPYQALLESVIERQADLIARWLLVGFIHGVMNTDNMSVMGETIDYGPCAFMDEYNPGKVYSSIDHHGRYAYDQQPGIGLWNLTRFAETLLSLLRENEDEAVESAQQALAGYSPRFQECYRAGLAQKLGFEAANEANQTLASTLLDTMATNRADFTLTFRSLSDLPLEDSGTDSRASTLFDEPAAFEAWAADWRAALAGEGRDDASRRAAMRAVNPAFIPRNHRVAEAIAAAANEQNLQPLECLLEVTAKPFSEHDELADYALPPQPHEVVHQTFCGT